MTEIDLEKVRGAVDLLRWCKKQRALVKEVEEKARAAVEATMGSHEVGLLDGEPAIQWPHYKERRFDQSAFGEEYPDLLEQYRATKEKRRFEVL